MIAFDTNILVHAHRGESPWHDRARVLVAEAATANAAWAIPWPCLHEFLSIVTKKIFRTPTPLAQALGQVEAWLSSPSLVALRESDAHWLALKRLVSSGRISGGAVHDARVAAICLEHGVSELLSADRDFSRFPELKVRNPLI